MKFGILKERKNPPDRRVIFSPDALAQLKLAYPNFSVVVESSKDRVFTDEEYQFAGIEVVDNLSDCDTLIGVKEIPADDLMAYKSYIFFSHTIKKQAHNREMLQSIIRKNINLFDFETMVDANNRRLIGFGQYAGYVGIYNSFRAFGQKFELFKLPKASTLSGKEELIRHLKRLVLPPLKIVITGKGKVSNGIKEILEEIKIKEVAPDHFLTKKYAQSVFTQLAVSDYYKHKEGNAFDFLDFKENPSAHESDFEKYSQVAEMYVSGHFHAPGSPEILSREMLQSKNSNIKVIGDISCDIDGPIASTIRSSTVDEPFYGYLPSENKEVDVFHPAAIVVMAVSNLPSELPRDASVGFGEMFIQHIMPAFFNEDKDGILECAQITQKGKLMPRFTFLEEYSK
ncbi:alanine dehydrogenase [Flavobacterium faecale]|uniref:Saccharopine dehydrogenase [NAD(+), L-lysine-forming] n=1 Tax=Flavobacterium faecale TaxID=1355330 RepID=A0A2S1LHJ7_9FLAO|nr:NAD(P)-dependent oxidoreductase [Flavobacterium faecale]AWG23178.1 alanine dehydrogenase [Flavobacterium faecale]